jgi:DNA-binding MarR family transcriptional regulator
MSRELTVASRKLAQRVARESVSADSRRAPHDPARQVRKPIQLGTLNDRVGYFVRRFQVWIFQDFMQTLKSAQIRPAQYSVLVLIGANAGLSQADLADALGIERARLVRLLDELERRGLTMRLRSTTDRRSHTLFLTPDGRRVLERLEILVARHERHVVDRLGSARRNALIKLLRDFG